MITGQALDRVDGRLKVCGQAKYAAEFELPRLTHAVIVQSRIAKGRVARIDAAVAQRMPGVLAVLTHENALKLPQGGRAAVNPPAGRVLSLLQDDQVHYNGEPIAVVIADTLERAQDAASKLRIDYSTGPASLDLEAARAKAYKPKIVQREEADTHRGDDVQAAQRDAAKHVQARYSTPVEHHNPMEPHATIASWNGDRLTLHDSTQYVTGVKTTLAKVLGLQPEQVEVVSPYVGGGFGCKGSAWSHVVLAAMAAKHVGRPVKLVLERPQMFFNVGYRPPTVQDIALGAQADGRLQAVDHAVLTETSEIEEWVESSAILTRMLYSCPNMSTSHRVAKLAVNTPTFMRAPGEATGSFAIESALDELSYATGIDPLELRLRNYAERDEQKDKPFSSKSLRECYRVAAERFGWSQRAARPGATRDGAWQVGVGMASATYPTNRMAASARARVLPDGTAVVQSGTQDLGTGTYTVMTQVAADALGLAPGKIKFELGDTRLPQAPVSGGSMTVASVSPAVRAACLALRERLIELAIADAHSPLHDAARDDIALIDGRLHVASAPARGEPIAALVARHGKAVEAEAKSAPGGEKNEYSMHAFGAVFAEVRVERELGIVRVPRIVASYGIGRLLNEKTGRSQLLGGIVWGVGMALTEETYRDVRDGRYVNSNLADYHVPVNADIGEIDVSVVSEDDSIVNPLGAKGIGEIGIVGVPAAIANAVYHATGIRVRELPITVDKLIAPRMQRA